MFAQALPPPPSAGSFESSAPPAAATDGVLFVARFGLEERRRFERACRRAGHRAIVVGAASVCRELLESDGIAPACVFVDPELGGARELVAWIRGAPRWCALSVIALVPHPAEGAYVHAHALGVDDVTLRSDLGTITRRLGALDGRPARPSAPTRGRAFVAHPDGERRRVVGRVLHQAGFEVAFASDAADLLRGVEACADTALVAIAEELARPGSALVGEVRGVAGKADLPVVILDIESGTEHAGGTLGRLGVVADAAAPDNLLFVVNELGAHASAEQRASQRLLYSTLCAFRRAHEVSPEFGLTYNISRDGIYVRTIDPPAIGTSVWLELRPPGTTAIVHLRAQVVWTRRAADRGHATVPSGFAVQVIEAECPPADLERYRAAYHAFREEPRPYVVEPTAEAPSTRPSSPSGLPRILVADDDERTLGVYRRLLAGRYEIVTASDGVDAIAKFSRGRFDVVLTDIGMPGANGLEVLRRVHDLRPAVPVIMATGAPTIDSAIEAVEHGAFRYLTKPFDAETLERTLERAVQIGRLARLKQDALHLHSDSLGRPTAAEEREAFERAIDGVYVVYQPIVSLRDRNVFGYEALVRSTEPTLPHPGALFAAAERLGELDTLGRAIRACAIAPFADRADRLLLNLHPRDLLDDELFDTTSPLADIAHRVTLEITERASLEGIPNSVRRIADLRAMGFTIAVDDIGAGYAGLTSFAQLEPDVAKLDMSLVRDIHRVPTKQRLVRSFAEVCDDLGIVLVCEGVETEEERDCLVELGCDVLQGYLFARPDRALIVPEL
ncbi:MAG: EAL domain-containing protein [Sandaracinaceae bacterium]|nr:EAL domain-containing protein [Sandaracinaceae bacterium]